MLLHRVRGLWNTYHGILAVILTVVFWTYLVITGAVSNGVSGGAQRFILYNLAGVLGLVIAAVRGRSAAATLLATGFVESHTLALRQTVYAGIGMLIVLLAGMDATDPGPLRISWLFGFLVVLYGVFLICHLLLPKRLADSLFSLEEHEQRTLLIGPIDKARRFSKWIENTAAFRFGMKGTVTGDDDREDEARILHLTRVSDASMFERIIRSEGIMQIVLLEIPSDREALNLLLSIANKTGVHVLVLNNLPETFDHGITLYNLHDQGFISLRNEPLQEVENRCIKRALDLIVSLAVVIFILPLACLIVKIFQAIQSPGPLFHRQSRSGVAKRPFRVFIFRTTHIDKHDSSSELETEPRVYPIGHILRKRGLDEIPQFLNVFFGDMSIVGPAPRSIIANRRFSEIAEAYHIRAWAKPGVTGLAQVKGYGRDPRNDREVEESAKLDIEYIENWSLPLDLWIGFKALLSNRRTPALH